MVWRQTITVGVAAVSLSFWEKPVGRSTGAVAGSFLNNFRLTETMVFSELLPLVKHLKH